MNQALIDRITNAVLYEGYLLYPYRASSVKNRQRWTFGGVYPQAWTAVQGSGDACVMQTECLVAGTSDTALHVRVRFLHLLERIVGRLYQPLADWPTAAEPAFERVQTLSVGDRVWNTWQEAVERTIEVPDRTLAQLVEQPLRHPFQFSPSRIVQPVREPGQAITGILVRQHESIEGDVEVSAGLAAAGLFKVRVRIHNRTPLPNAGQLGREQAQLRALASTHTILQVRAGAFVSLLDPPPGWKQLAAGCDNVGTWPVLVGAEGETDAMLSSPIILYDYPQVAVESPGDLFDATEIDEILTLRILTMTDEEKREMTANDERGRALLERTEALARDQLMQLHGTVRNLRALPTLEADPRKLECVRIGPFEVRKGDRVRLRPRGAADIMDIALAGKTATVESVEQDFENQVHLAVSVDDDPGKDLGSTGQPGHRFFFRPEEVEPLGTDEDLT